MGMFSSLQCIFYDFDGVMTDNRVLVDETGKEAVFANRSDGLAVGKIKGLGIPQVIVSTEVNPVVEKRAEKIKIPCIHGVESKKEIVEKYCADHGYDMQKVMFIGNDLNDEEVMRAVGLCGAPADAEDEILIFADWISSRKGGYGVIRELYRELSKDI